MGMVKISIENNGIVAFPCLKSMPRSRSGASIVTTPTRIPHSCTEAVESKATVAHLYSKSWSADGRGESRSAGTRALHRFEMQKCNSCKIFDIHVHHTVRMMRCWTGVSDDVFVCECIFTGLILVYIYMAVSRLFSYEKIGFGPTLAIFLMKT